MIEKIAKAGFAPVSNAVAQKLIPAAALGVISTTGEKGIALAGSAAIVPEEERLTRNHWFDLASLAKVIATSTMILKLADDGLIGLDRPLTDAIPDLRQIDPDNAAERKLTFRDCLAHRTFCPQPSQYIHMATIRLACAHSSFSMIGSTLLPCIRTSTSSYSALRLNVLPEGDCRIGSWAKGCVTANRPGQQWRPSIVIGAGAY